MRSRPARAVRGLVVATVSALIAALSHAAGGGVFPGVPILVVAVLFGGIFCVSVAGTRVSTVRTTLSVAVSQLLMHGVFSLGGGPMPFDTDGHHGTPSLPMPADAAMTAHPMEHGPGMLIAHVVAGIATVAMLRFGEAAFWAVTDAARHLLRPVILAVATVVPVERPTSVVRGSGFVPSFPAVLLTANRHRGPPALAV